MNIKKQKCLQVWQKINIFYPVIKDAVELEHLPIQQNLYFQIKF